MKSFVDKIMLINEIAAAYHQLLCALLLANIPFAFVDNSEVIKLFKMLL